MASKHGAAGGEFRSFTPRETGKCYTPTRYIFGDGRGRRPPLSHFAGARAEAWPALLLASPNFCPPPTALHYRPRQRPQEARRAMFTPCEALHYPCPENGPYSRF